MVIVHLFFPSPPCSDVDVGALENLVLVAWMAVGILLTSFAINRWGSRCG
ncbi:hypothetical protein HMPREF9614_01426 [Cutibacterium acnes HL002PA2]|nr:hypothetical protein HMPREF9575_00939 [Cutibacterium acnes HL110PA1]EFS47141.1 hypothetical protein HMPREF9580_00003 [Cutibacterium acnes HL087PA2]EFS83295.1 hypothetical protein HMPREF9600_02392 [Cutibacterium acnes HL050PA3]EFT04819.1 hypothetical protein HMPREF9614_01426 [Cutibacterium acnes HL002PA2]EFT32910.1 hypothetical protein HMPREF9596_02396 [Cutibacterium acnes HL005PA3]